MLKKYALWFLWMCAFPLYAAAPQVVVTINPIYALTAGVMQGVGEPILLVAPGASPHNYALRPTQVKNLYAADVVIWVGEELETFLNKTLKQLPDSVHRLTLLSVPGIDPLPARRADAWQHDESHAHSHAHQDVDPHLWLDPLRAQIMVAAIADTLARVDPAHQPQYQANAKAMHQQLTQLHQALQQTLTPLKAIPFVVFHDAYQYLEQRYGLNAVGAITVNPEIMPSAHRVSEIQHTIKKLGAVCIFAEPQFRPAIVETIAKATGVREGVLDPLGVIAMQNVSAYDNLLLQLGSALSTCLIPTN